MSNPEGVYKCVCGGTIFATIVKGKKIAIRSCKKMRAFTDKQLDDIEQAFKDFENENLDKNTIKYYCFEIKKRLDYLVPLVKELQNKGYYLEQICPELASEWNRLIFIRNNILNKKYFDL